MVAKQSLQIAIIGAGGLAHAALWGLLTGWQENTLLRISIFDPQFVERSNLNRQVFFFESDIGQAKVNALARNVSSYKKSSCEIISQQIAIDETNINSLLIDQDYIVDATDSTRTKFLINDFCITRRISFCYGGVLGTAGQILAVNPARVNHPACLRCLFGDFNDSDYDTFHTSCQAGGVFGPVVGQIGLLQANFALSCLTGEKQETSLLLRFSLDRLEHDLSPVLPALDCPHLLATQTRQSNARAIAREIDLSDQNCPMTFVYTKLALEQLQERETLRATYSSVESAERVMNSCREEGHRILEGPIKLAEQKWELLLERGHLK